MHPRWIRNYFHLLELCELRARPEYITSSNTADRWVGTNVQELLLTGLQWACLSVKQLNFHCVTNIAYCRKILIE